MKKKIILAGVILAVFLMLMTPVVSSINAQPAITKEKLQTEKCSLCAYVNEKADSIFGKNYCRLMSAAMASLATFSALIGNSIIVTDENGQEIAIVIPFKPTLSYFRTYDYLFNMCKEGLGLD